MKYLIPCCIALCCSSSVALGQEQVVRNTLMHNGVLREYILYVPSSYSPDESLPLVLNLHGLGGNGTSQMNLFQMNPVAEREGFLSAYPSAIAGDWSDDIPDAIADPNGDFSVSFIDSVLDAIQSEYSVDPSRIYSTGYSQGGNTSYILAAARPNTFAAIASVAGTRAKSEGLADPPEALFPPSIPHVAERPFPVLHVHGTADTIAPYEGGENVFNGKLIKNPPVERVLDEWVANNGCQDAASISDLPNTYAADESTATLFSYQECDTYTTVSGANQTAEVLLYRVNNGGHSWPLDPDRRPDPKTTPAWAYPINSDFDGSSEIWDFFARHELPGIVGDFDHSGLLDEPDINMLGWKSAHGTNDLRFDLTHDHLVDGVDVAFWIKDLKKSWIGDSNLDLEFNSTDLVAVVAAGKYELDAEADWTEGDWTGDHRFDSADLVAAFADGGYELRPPGEAMAVPEPALIVLAMVGFIGIAIRRGWVSRQARLETAISLDDDNSILACTASTGPFSGQ